MHKKVDGLVAERDRPEGEERWKYPGTKKVINGNPADAVRDGQMTIDATS